MTTALQLKPMTMNRQRNINVIRVTALNSLSYRSSPLNQLGSFRRNSASQIIYAIQIITKLANISAHI